MSDHLPGNPPTIKELILLIIAVAMLIGPLLIADYLFRGAP